MYTVLPENFIRLAERADFPVYVVGGSVRDFLIGIAPSDGRVDWDICAPVPPERFVSLAEGAGFCVRSVYKTTGTVKLCDKEGTEYEFASFRSDEYVRGEHRPVRTTFTADVHKDALRRDFTCNAIYYDPVRREFIDPLGGIGDVKTCTLRTVREAKRVFSEDGLRLLRLARQAACLGFRPSAETAEGARENARLIADVVPERIQAELNALLSADEKYGIQGGAYHGLCVLRDTGVLRQILPELAEGDKMPQRAEYHAYDVLEHTFRCVMYAPASLRLAALLHDVGKPSCYRRCGNAYGHEEVGAEMAEQILTRLSYPKRTVARVCALVRYHMMDSDCRMRENKLRRFLVEHHDLTDDLLALKQADYSACKDDLSSAPSLRRWKTLLEKMEKEGVPMQLKALKISGKDLLEGGMPAPKVGKTLNELWLYCACFPSENQRERLLRLAFGKPKGKDSRP